MTTFSPGILGPIRGPGDAPPIVFWDDFIGNCGYVAGQGTQASAQGKFSELENFGDWHVTPAAGTELIVPLDNAPGGIIRITNSAADNDVLNAQMNGEAWTLDADKELVFEIRMSIADVSEADWLVGLAIEDVGILNTATDYGTTEFIGFACADSTGDIDAVTVTGTSETITDTGSDLADATMVRLGFNATSDRVLFYVDGVLKAKHTTDISGDNLTLTMEFRNDGTVADVTTDIDYIYCSRER
jgi:hypothetical protein